MGFVHELFLISLLKGITRHLKRRTESTHIWLGKSILPTSRSTMGMTKVSNHQEYSCDFQAEEKKQDDDPMDLEIGSSSSAAFSNDHRSVHSCSTGTGQPAHQHVPESNLSSLHSHDENSSLGMIPNDRTILSLNDEYYKEIMWNHYRMLGKTRDSDREIQIGNDIFNTFRQQMGKTGRFFKRAQYQDFEVDDETALASEFRSFDAFIPVTLLCCLFNVLFPRVYQSHSSLNPFDFQK